MNMKQKRFMQMAATPKTKVEGMINNDKDFLKILSKKLMLDELLCGEQDAESFLIEMMIESAKEVHEMYMKDSMERRIKMNSEWLANQ